MSTGADGHSDGAYEFDCQDCGRHVIMFMRGGNSPTHCSSCAWVNEFIEGAEQAEVRQLLGVPLKSSLHEVLRPTPREAYRDDSYLPRHCDRCQKVYRGPAVYCSLDCAMADA